MTSKKEYTAKKPRGYPLGNITLSKGESMYLFMNPTDTRLD